jgi:hypothetical protein
VLELIDDKLTYQFTSPIQKPTFNHPEGKGSSLFPTTQFFSFKTVEDSMTENLNKFKE